MRASISFLANRVLDTMNGKEGKLSELLDVRMPLGLSTRTSWYIQRSMSIDGQDFEAQLVCPPLKEIDIILGMD